MKLHSPFLQQCYGALLAQQYAPRTAALYVVWMRRFIAFHHLRQATDLQTLTAAHLTAFFAATTSREQGSATRHNQALAALLVLYRDILDLPTPGDARRVSPLRAKTPKRLPNCLTKDETKAILEYMHGAPKLMAQLCYGAGLKASECVALRIQAIDFETRTIRLADHETILPECLIVPLQQRIGFVQACYQARNLTDVVQWYVFPAEDLFDPDATVTAYRPASVSTLQKAISQAARHTPDLMHRASAQALRDSFAVALLCQGEHIRTVQELLGIKDIRTAMKYLSCVPFEQRATRYYAECSV
jgi:site-specific recombinase XerD